QEVYDKLRYELQEGFTPYNKLKKEYQVYQSNIVTLLNKNGIIISDAVDANDATQKAWATDEVISLGEYLQYCIAQNWIDVSKLELNEKYSDSTEIYNKLADVIINVIEKNTEFQKRFYKYMLLNDVINGKQICTILCEQNEVDIPPEDVEALYSGGITAYQFMMNRIQNLDITAAQLALDPCNASVVVTDVNTGDVLALVSYPGYDNNKMANSIDAEYYAKLNADKSNPQYNFATQYKAAPGSTFKIVSASAGLLENVITLNGHTNCTGTFTSIVPSPRCWKVSGHGFENVTSAIRDSCNYFFYDVGYKLATTAGSYNEEAGLEALAKYAEMYGLTEKSGVEIGEETPDVSNSDPVRSAIGQGTNSYTTVGLARYAATIANSGTCYDLTLLDKIADANGNVLKTFEPKVRNVIDIPAEYWNAFHLGMRQVVQNKSYYSDLAVNVAGKTGTAEQTKSRPNHALFICYAPYESPEIAIATRIPFGYSSDYAAQFTRDIIKYYYGLVEEEDLINGVADAPDGGVSNEM
ncbi:MAG: penicillin-binding protein, partial [Acetatifactor sp.]|nr:penicillin-binding protein [Acetatifactor sp.]